jgi:DNA repair exonuclease SbcCD ATPase subunit
MRALSQIQQREATLQRNEDILYHADYRIRELQDALEKSENSKEILNQDLQVLLGEVRPLPLPSSLSCGPGYVLFS